MLGSFQNLYPTSCLLTELVQIYNGKYIVKASLQIEGITRTTGMAAAEILEEAEDRARERAFFIFTTADSATTQLTTQTNALAKFPVGETAPKEPGIAIPSMSITPINASINDAMVQSTSLETIATPSSIPTPAKTAKKTTTDIKANIVETEEKLEPKVEPKVEPTVEPKSNIVSTEKPQEVRADEPELKSELESPLELEEAIIEAQREYAIAPVPQKSTSPTKTSATSKEPNQDSPKNLSQNLNQNLSKEVNEITTPVTQIEPLPEQEQLFDISLESLAASVPTPEPELPFAESNMESSHTATGNIMPFTPSDYNPPKEIEIPLPPVPETAPTTTTSKRKKNSEPEDNSDDIAKIGVEMQRLGWTIEDGRNYLFQTYGKKSRHVLSREELLEFLHYLKSQPTSEDPLGIDPIAGF
jgi:hypothetical protein